MSHKTANILVLGNGSNIVKENTKYGY